MKRTENERRVTDEGFRDTLEKSRNKKGYGKRLFFSFLLLFNIFKAQKQREPMIRRKKERKTERKRNHSEDVTQLIKPSHHRQTKLSLLLACLFLFDLSLLFVDFPYFLAISSFIFPLKKIHLPIRFFVFIPSFP